ncbi:MAG: hypothetical protein K8S56_01005, partial [Candidatus Cloacimonetes bacterium]|nr:hypothetical protein [Candidatus Cloacimonadota bacterium]
MAVHIRRISHCMIEFSKQKTNHLKFIKSVHKLLSKELNLPRSVFVLSIENYFLKSSYQSYPEEILDMRTNELEHNDRFPRLTVIEESEIGFNEQQDLK